MSKQEAKPSILPNKTSITHPDGGKESYAYSPQGTLLSHTDTMGASTHYSTDKTGNLVEIVDPKGSAVHFGYDVEGRLLLQNIGSR